MRISNDGPEVFCSYASRSKSRSEITVWMPWPLNCDLGGGAKWPSNSLPPIYRVLHMYRSTGNASSVHVWLAGYPDILLPLWNAKSQIRSLVCTLCNSNIATTSLVCRLHNSKCAIQMIIQFTHFALVWNQSQSVPLSYQARSAEVFSNICNAAWCELMPQSCINWCRSWKSRIWPVRSATTWTGVLETYSNQKLQFVVVRLPMWKGTKYEGTKLLYVETKNVLTPYPRTKKH